MSQHPISGPGGSRVGVRCAFSCSAAPGWQIRRLRLTEELSRPYGATVELVHPDPEADPGEFLGRSCSFTLEHDAFVRPIAGLVTQMRRAGADAERRWARCEIRVVPAVELLGQTQDTRIFQHKSVPEILEEVLGRRLSRYGRSIRSELTRGYPQREYTLQYRESDLSFAHRLMEEEGIAYAFDQEEEVEVLVLYDANRSFPELASTTDAEVRFCSLRGDSGQEEAVRSWEATASLVTTNVAVRDFDWSAPGVPVEHEVRHEDLRDQDRERYEHGRALTIGDYDEGLLRYTAYDAEEQARLRHELHAQGARRAEGSSDVCRLTVGRIFELSGHPEGSDGRYLLTRVRHELEVGEHGWAQPGSYTNRFEVQPSDVPFRPARRTPKPRIHGAQTATVVGPEGESIHTDEHGRIKVQFQWDREGRCDERSSCWVRVQQLWGGDGWGFLFLPRLGMEVVVSFLDGDPDRPLVTGCVYNGQNRAPIDLPASRSQSGFRSRSVGRETGGNELILEDAPERERVYLFAERDFDEVVQRNHTTTIEGEQTNAVTKSQTETVGEDQSLTVSGHRRKTVERSETVEVQDTRTTEIHKAETLRARATREVEVTEDDSLRVGGAHRLHVAGETEATHERSRAVLVQRDERLRVQGTTTLHSDGTLLVQQGDAQRVCLDDRIEVSSDSTLRIATAHASVEIAVDGALTLHSERKITLSSPEIELVAGNNRVKLGDGKVEIAGESEASMGTGDSAVALDASGVTVSGATIRSSATTMNDLSGPIVTVN